MNITVTEPTSLNPGLPATELMTYINQRNRELIIDINLHKNIIIYGQLVNVNGTIVKSLNYDKLKIGKNRLTEDLSHLNPGIFIIQLSDGRNTINKKLMILNN